VSSLSGARIPLALSALLAAFGSLHAQDQTKRYEAVPLEGHRVYPINLATALQLSQSRSLDVQVAAERVAAANAQLDLARSRWLPTIVIGGDYARQDGRIQDIVGKVFSTSRSSVMVGAGPTAVFSPSEAILGPLAARQTAGARVADVRAAENGTLLSVAEAYFAIQRARGELAGALEAERLATDLVRRAEKLAEGLAQPVEVHRAKTELARRQSAVELARERYDVASADLNRLLRLPQGVLLEPEELPQMQVELFDSSSSIDDLIPVGLTNRPELASRQALVQATLARLRQEKLRPLVPSVLLRGNATNPAGTLSSGYFGGGVNGDVSNFGWRNSVDVQVLWELQGLGFGNAALVREREADSRSAMLDLMRTQDRVAAEVAQAYSQATRAASRAKIASEGLKEATETVKTNLAGLSQTRRVGDTLVLIFRPQEVVAAVQGLDQAYRDYFGAVAEANVAQFRLYRALGQPAACVLAKKKPEELPRPAARLAEPRPVENVSLVIPSSHTLPPSETPRTGTGFATDRRP
jgi:outer membrane protein TolC